MSAAPSLHGNILDNMGDGVVAVDRRGVITSFNAAAGAIMGVAPDASPGGLVTDVLVLGKWLDH
ncbi:MAG: PAS domain-containing protein, partial [Acidobacteriota bacterium]|nr:PAS domain-containing protein [Acidobacteriota bacterium]